MKLYKVTTTILCSKFVEADDEKDALDQISANEFINSDIVDSYIVDEIKVESVKTKQ